MPGILPPPGAPPPPSRSQLEAARASAVADLVFAGMRVLLCGINPSLWSGYAGYHFARPANRLWTSLFEAGFTPRRLHPADIAAIQAAGIGITDLVARVTARAEELADCELRAGMVTLGETAQTWRPDHVAVLGISAYRTASGDRGAAPGRQPGRLGGAALWVLPNPSGLNAHYGQPALTAAYGELARAAGYPPVTRRSRIRAS